MDFLYIILLSYLFGTIPFALIFVKLTVNKDIRKEGTGNVGAMNSYDITGKKWIGICVTICDCFKGIFAIVIAIIIAGDYPISYVLASFFVVLGHNYNLFLKFKGGRGLATAFGCLICINLFFPICWAILWLIGFYLIKKNVHIANSFATFLLPFFPFVLPFEFFQNFSFFLNLPETHLKIVIVLLCFLVLARHLNVISRPVLKVEKKK